MADQSDEQVFGPPQRTLGSSSQGSEFMPSVRRTGTWEDSTPVIDDFVKQYSKEREHWQACAKKAQDLIETQLEKARDENNEEIFAKVTSRAKEIRSLEEKLKLRNFDRKEAGKMPYESNEEIADEIVDLAGVRVVLYTPNMAQREKVKDVIKSIWGAGVDEKLHRDPRPKEPTEDKKQGRDIYVPRHLGYQAEHYRASMLSTQAERNKYNWIEGDRVEIQVVSALGHAWAEAGHDVLYKSHAYGRSTRTEQRILDALNGLIVSGDLLLEQFRESVTKRTVELWKYSGDLEEFLRESDILEHNDQDNNTVTQWDHFSPVGVDILFRFLTKIGQNHGLAVRNALRDLGYPQNPELGLKEQMRKVRPAIKITEKLLTSFCIIARLLPPRPEGQTMNDAQQLRTMLDAMILLQIFAESPKGATDYLMNPGIEMSDIQTKALNMVLRDTQRDRCLIGEKLPFLQKHLRSAWEWFETQAANKKSLCGLLFRLAEMGVPGKVLSDAERLQELAIGPLRQRDGSTSSL